jgi:hypothetical protein
VGSHPAAVLNHLQLPQPEIQHLGLRELDTPTEAIVRKFIPTDTVDTRGMVDTGMVPAAASLTPAHHSDAAAHVHTVREDLVLPTGLSVLSLPAASGSLHPADLEPPTVQHVSRFGHHQPGTGAAAA